MASSWLSFLCYDVLDHFIRRVLTALMYTTWFVVRMSPKCATFINRLLYWNVNWRAPKRLSSQASRGGRSREGDPNTNKLWCAIDCVIWFSTTNLVSLVWSKWVCVINIVRFGKTCFLINSKTKVLFGIPNEETLFVCLYVY